MLSESTGHPAEFYNDESHFLEQIRRAVLAKNGAWANCVGTCGTPLLLKKC